MSYREQMLNQVQVTTVNPTVLYTPTKKLIARVERIIICNYSKDVSILSLYHDDDGTTADNTTVIMSEVPFGINLFRVIPIGIYLNNIESGGGSLIAVAEFGSVFNITLYGTEIK
jgi:hypothetical protein